MHKSDRDRNGETRENTEWHNIVAWRSNADLVEKFVHKGSQIYIEGKLRTRQWTDQTGNKRFTTEVNADNIQLLGKRPDGPQPGGNVVPCQSWLNDVVLFPDDHDNGFASRTQPSSPPDA